MPRIQRPLYEEQWREKNGEEWGGNQLIDDKKGSEAGIAQDRHCCNSSRDDWNAKMSKMSICPRSMDQPGWTGDNG